MQGAAPTSGTSIRRPITTTAQRSTICCTRASGAGFVCVGFSKRSVRSPRAIGISERNGLARYESLQMYYSIAGRDLEREVVPLAKDEQLAILPWSPLAGGFLSGKFTRDSAPTEGARRAAFDFPPVDKEKAYDIIDVMKEIGDARGVSVAQIALSWLLHQKHVTSVIIGAKTEAQLADNIAATSVELSSDDLQSSTRSRS